MVRYPKYVVELEQMLTEDQQQWKSFWAKYFSKQNERSFKNEFAYIRSEQSVRSHRMLDILREIEIPSLTNIGTQGTIAVSILALHDKLGVLKEVLDSFETSYKLNKEDTYYQAIPSMIDRVRILERKPQVFGTQWEIDKNNYPFLPTVEDFENVNDRRKEYDIEPLRWPKSLAIPEAQQPWLKRPISEAIMRDLTDEEFQEKNQSYIV